MKIQDILSTLVPVTIDHAALNLDQDLKAAIPFLKKAMSCIDELYRKQQSEDLPDLYDKVVNGAVSSEISAEKPDDLRKFFLCFNGPWNSLENYTSVLKGVEKRPKGCAFYPSDLSKEELEKHISTLSADNKDLFLDNYSVIRRNKDHSLNAIPYHKYYRDILQNAAKNLEEAATRINNPVLKTHLCNRANVLLNGDYRSSDSFWVQMKNPPLEVIIGPYETYDDRLMGIKTSYEAMLLATDKTRGQELSTIEDNIQVFAKAFPLPENSLAAVGGLAPITVVNQIYSAGEAKAGIMASAFNLPNDPWIRKNVGWKQVMIYNIMNAKFDNCTRRISEIVVENGQNALFEPYFYFVLLHEVSHGLGPAYRSNGEAVSKCLHEYSSGIEEAKADIGSMYLLLKFSGKYGLPHFTKDQLLNSYLAGLFRSMRFGLHEAHGAANILQFNWFFGKNILFNESKKNFSTEPNRLEQATEELLQTLTNLQANGTVSEVKSFLSKYTKVPPCVSETMERLSSVPIDIRVTWK